MLRILFNVAVISQLYCVLDDLQKWYCAKRKKKELKKKKENCKIELRSCVLIFLVILLMCIYEIISKLKKMSKWLLTFRT